MNYMKKKKTLHTLKAFITEKKPTSYHNGLKLNCHDKPQIRVGIVVDIYCNSLQVSLMMIPAAEKAQICSWFMSLYDSTTKRKSFAFPQFNLVFI